MEASKSITPYFEESVVTRSYIDEIEEDEYYDNIDNQLGDDWDPNEPLTPLIPLKYTSTTESNTECSVSLSSSIVFIDDSKLELFFDTFIDIEIEGEITICQWLSSLNELGVDLTEKQMYKMFSYIDQDRTGYIDAVDFIKFCAIKSFDNNEHHDIKILQEALNYTIENHPFMINS